MDMLLKIQMADEEIMEVAQKNPPEITQNVKKKKKKKNVPIDSES